MRYTKVHTHTKFHSSGQALCFRTWKPCKPVFCTRYPVDTLGLLPNPAVAAVPQSSARWSHKDESSLEVGFYVYQAVNKFQTLNICQSTIHGTLVESTIMSSSQGAYG